MILPKPNFQQMSLQELRHYILAHRDDLDAWQEYTGRPRTNAVYFDSEMSPSEQETKLRELLEKKANPIARSLLNPTTAVKYPVGAHRVRPFP